MSRLVDILKRKIELAGAIREAVEPPGEGPPSLDFLADGMARREALVREFSSFDAEFNALWNGWRENPDPRKDSAPSPLADQLMARIREIQERDQVLARRLEVLREVLDGKMRGVRRARQALGGYSARFHSAQLPRFADKRA